MFLYPKMTSEFNASKSIKLSYAHGKWHLNGELTFIFLGEKYYCNYLVHILKCNNIIAAFYHGTLVE